MKTTPPRSKLRTWQLQTAKARFSEVFERARTEGPQRVTRRGKEAVVILRAEEYQKVTEHTKPKESLWEFLRKSPLVGLDLDLERSRELPRDFKFEP
jgi:prevent-host-death family protein